MDRSSVVVFVDIDGTLVRCNTQLELAREMRAANLIPFKNAVQLILWAILQRIGIVRETIGIRRRQYKVLEGMSVARFNSLVDDAYNKRIKGSINQDVVRELQGHLANKHEIILLSASLTNLCLKLASDLGLHHVYATELIIENDHYSGNWKGSILEGEHKMNFVKQWASSHNISLKNCFAYADHATDQAMLSVVGHPVVVNPSPIMLKIAKKNHWRILFSK